MIVLAIVATLAAAIWSLVVVLSNGMSDSPQSGFQGLGTVIAAWVGVAVLWLAWLVG